MNENWWFYWPNKYTEWTWKHKFLLKIDVWWFSTTLIAFKITGK
jgi:hypothetical protein